jgi:hypothetical protein
VAKRGVGALRGPFELRFSGRCAQWLKRPPANSSIAEKGNSRSRFPRRVVNSVRRKRNSLSSTERKRHSLSQAARRPPAPNDPLLAAIGGSELPNSYSEPLQKFLDQPALTIKEMILEGLTHHFRHGATPSELRDYTQFRSCFFEARFTRLLRTAPEPGGANGRTSALVVYGRPQAIGGCSRGSHGRTMARLPWNAGLRDSVLLGCSTILRISRHSREC